MEGKYKLISFVNSKDNHFLSIFFKNLLTNNIIETSIKQQNIKFNSAILDDTFDLTLIPIYKSFDFFTNIPENKKSIGIQVTLQAIDKTFVDEEIKAICNSIIVSVEKNIGGILRDK